MKLIDFFTNLSGNDLMWLVSAHVLLRYHGNQFLRGLFLGNGRSHFNEKKPFSHRNVCVLSTLGFISGDMSRNSVYDRHHKVSPNLYYY